MAKSKKKAKRERTVVCAQEFRLEDAQGNTRCLIFADDSSQGGHAAIHLLDSNNRARLSLSVRGDGTPLIALLNENGATALGIGISPLLGSGLIIHHSTGAPFLTLGVSPGGELYYPCRCAEESFKPAVPSIDHVPEKGASTADSAQKMRPKQTTRRRQKSR